MSNDTQQDDFANNERIDRAQRDDHARLIRVAANWYGLYNELFVKAQRLTDENARLRAALQSAEEEIVRLRKVVGEE